MMTTLAFNELSDYEKDKITMLLKSVFSPMVTPKLMMWYIENDIWSQWIVPKISRYTKGFAMGVAGGMNFSCNKHFKGMS